MQTEENDSVIVTHFGYYYKNVVKAHRSIYSFLEVQDATSKCRDETIGYTDQELLNSTKTCLIDQLTVASKQFSNTHQPS